MKKYIIISYVIHQNVGGTNLRGNVSGMFEMLSKIKFCWGYLHWNFYEHSKMIYCIRESVDLNGALKSYFHY